MDIVNFANHNYSQVIDRTLQFEIGYHFYEGAGNDKQRGINFFESSASQGYARAQVILGFIFWNGENVSEDKEKGMRLLELAASQGNAEALTYMFKIYEEQENYEEALQYLLRAAECGKVDMQFLLGILHIRQFRNEDKEVEVRNKNRDEAIRWLDAAANNDHHEAQFNLGLLQMQGNPDEQSSGIKWMKIAASNQYQDAIEWIAANPLE